MPVINAIHYQTNCPAAVTVVNGVIENIKEVPAGNGNLPYIGPGLIDLQVNGCFGIDFNSKDTTIADVSRITHLLLANGVTQYYPTVITNRRASIKTQLALIDEACQKIPSVNECVGGIHLEGPFISAQDGPVGAHNKQYVQAPDWNLFSEFQDAAGGRIKIITLSPEWPNAAKFTRQCVQQNIIVSIGHTAATTAQIAAVVDAGATLSTHLGNGTHQLLPRHPNYIWDQLADERLAASFIGDGFHLPASVIKVIGQVKGNRAILVSDSVSLAGMPAGAYQTPVGGQVVLTDDGKLHLQGKPNTLAGSAMSLIEAVQKLWQNNITGLPAAINMASLNPAALTNPRQLYGLIAGAPADFMTFYDNQGQLIVNTVYKNGNQVYTIQA